MSTTKPEKIEYLKIDLFSSEPECTFRRYFLKDGKQYIESGVVKADTGEIIGTPKVEECSPENGIVGVFRIEIMPSGEIRTIPFGSKEWYE